MPTERYKVRVTKDHLVFCSGHFISYEGDKWERLHGHNYRTAVEIEGDLDENRYVFDFIALKHRTKAITDELDHRMMLATKNPLIGVEEGPRSVRVRYREREWVFPREDCVLLSIENTTAELLAHFIGTRLLQDLVRYHNFRPEVLRVEVEENIGQSATCEWRGALGKFSKPQAGRAHFSHFAIFARVTEPSLQDLAISAVPSPQISTRPQSLTFRMPPP